MDFVSVDAFFVTSEKEFDARVTGLSSILPRCLDTTVQQVAEKEDEGSLEVTTWSLPFISCRGRIFVHDLSRWRACITEVKIQRTPFITKEKEAFNEITLELVQASYICRDNGEYLKGTGLPRRELATCATLPGSFAYSTIMAHLPSRFPVKYTLLSKSAPVGSIPEDLPTFVPTLPSTPAKIKTIVTSTYQKFLC